MKDEEGRDLLDRIETAKARKHLRQHGYYEEETPVSHHTVKLPYTKVSRKVMAAGAVGTPVAALLMWLVPVIFKVPIPPEVAAGLGSLIATGVGYIVKELKENVDAAKEGP